MQHIIIFNEHYKNKGLVEENSLLRDNLDELKINIENLEKENNEIRNNIEEEAKKAVSNILSEYFEK